MLDMGFAEDIDFIIGHTPPSRQTLLFSATFPDDIESLSARYQRAAQRITVDSGHTGASITQQFFSCGVAEKDDLRHAAVLKLLRHYSPESCVVFCNMRQTTTDCARYLSNAGLCAMPLHGELEQRERDQVLIQFRNGSCQVLVATDVAARGLDIEDLPMVINADLPRDLEVYTHRIGRTGRAGNTGMAMSVFFENERFRVDALRARPENADATNIQPIAVVPADHSKPLAPAKQTLSISGGRKNKIRPGDVLGALTADGIIAGDSIGRIDIMEHASFVAVDTKVVKLALQQLDSRRIKGQKFKVRLCES